MKKIVIALLLLTLVACNQSEIIKNIELDQVIDVSSPIEFYELTMSSVPGFPIEIKVSEDFRQSDYKIQFVVDEGNLLTWEDAVVKIYEKQLRVNLTDTSVYWSPNDCEETHAGCTVRLAVVDDSNNIVASEVLHIVSENGRYVFDND